MPETDALIQVLRAEGLAAVVSGAGPSILVLGSTPLERLTATDLIHEHATTEWTCLLLAVDFRGATVVPHPTEAVA
jgi:homoserine kinase